MEIEDIITTIDDKEVSLPIDKSFSLAKTTSILLRNDKDEGKGRRIIIHILDNWKKIPEETIEIWTDLIEAAGFYPYLEKEKENLKFNNLAGEIRKESHLSENLENKYFHEEQKYLKEILVSGKNLIVSAPTSFGKSLLIEEVLASKKFKNIVVIQPTLALLDETRKKLKKYRENYKIIVRTSQKISEEKSNLFLLTAERVMEYHDLPQIDFFVIDEFYKLSNQRDDERSDILNNAFYKILHSVPQFYLLGPNIDGISEGFAEKYNAKFYKTDYSLIDNKTIDIYSQYPEFKKPIKNKDFIEKTLFSLLVDLKEEQTIIYCSSPVKVRYLAEKFTNFLAKEKNIEKSKRLPLVEWIEENVHPDWNLIDFLNFEIGINDGGLPKHINSSIIDYFNQRKLKYIFCTSTIIEGVNTSAKNIIFFDKTKGKQKPIDYFDYSNIKGRAGRMMIHYIGKIYNFNPSPSPKKEEMIVDIPFYQQSPIKDEVLNGLKEYDIKNEVKDTNQYKKLLEISQEERELFQKNGVLIQGQKKILDLISHLDDTHQISRKNSNHNRYYEIYDLIKWDGKPSYDQLQFVLSLCCDHLIKNTSPMRVSTLVKLTFDYGREQNLSLLIEHDFLYKKSLEKNKKKSDREIRNESITDIFKISRDWFQYKIPKWLRVMNEIQEYVCKKNNRTPGDYIFYANQIENDFVSNNLTILLEYGIPTSAIKKISLSISKELSEDIVLQEVKKISEQSNSLIQYERDIIKNSL